MCVINLCKNATPECLHCVLVAVQVRGTFGLYESLHSKPFAYICRAGQNHTFMGIYGVHTVCLAGNSPYIR